MELEKKNFFSFFLVSEGKLVDFNSKFLFIACYDGDNPSHLFKRLDKRPMRRLAGLIPISSGPIHFSNAT